MIKNSFPKLMLSIVVIGCMLGLANLVPVFGAAPLRIPTDAYGKAVFVKSKTITTIPLYIHVEVYVDSDGAATAVSFDSHTNITTKTQANQARAGTNWGVDFDQINWDVDFNQIYDGEIFYASVINEDWLNRFRVGDTLTTHSSVWENSIMVRGIILFGPHLIILNNNQYIILDHIETIGQVKLAMNINFDDTPISLAGLSWSFAKVYFPFVSNDIIERVVEVYNFQNIPSQHRNASDYFN